MPKEVAIVYTDKEVETPEVGDRVMVEFSPNPHSGPWKGHVSFLATWLGTVSNGKELAEAMRLMGEIAEGRDG